MGSVRPPLAVWESANNSPEPIGTLIGDAPWQSPPPILFNYMTIRRQGGHKETMDGQEAPQHASAPIRGGRSAPHGGRSIERERPMRTRWGPEVTSETKFQKKRRMPPIGFQDAPLEAPSKPPGAPQNARNGNPGARRDLKEHAGREGRARHGGPGLDVYTRACSDRARIGAGARLNLVTAALLRSDVGGDAAGISKNNDHNDYKITRAVGKRATTRSLLQAAIEGRGRRGRMWRERWKDEEEGKGG